MINILYTVALLADIPEKHLSRGQVGTVVEILKDGVYEVEFSDDERRTYANLALAETQLMGLKYDLVAQHLPFYDLKKYPAKLQGVTSCLLRLNSKQPSAKYAVFVPDFHLVHLEARVSLLRQLSVNP